MIDGHRSARIALSGEFDIASADDVGRAVHGGDPVRRVLTVSGVTALFEDADDRDSAP